MRKILEDLKDFIGEQPFDIIRFTDIKDGVSETLEYTPANPLQNCYSGAKTFTMTAIGILYDKGLIAMEDKVCDILKDGFPEKADPRWKNVTIEMCLTHRAGLPGGFLDIDCSDPLTFTDDYLHYMFLYPMAYTPGTDCLYSDGAFYLLSCIVEKISGLGTDNFLWKEICTGMKFREMAWSHCPKGHSMGGTGLYLHSADLAKIALLYLNKGIYEGKRYLSEEWCNMAMEREYALDRDETGKVWFKGGMFGQKMFLIPEQNRACGLQAYGGDSDVILKFIRDYSE